MKPYWKKKFIAALQSGKYKRGRGLLRGKSGGYCPLGVLCDVVDPNKWRKPGPNAALPHWRYDTDYYAFPPPAVLRKVGVPDQDAWYLCNLQDKDRRMTLARTAEYVQAHW